MGISIIRKARPTAPVLIVLTLVASPPAWCSTGGVDGYLPWLATHLFQELFLQFSLHIWRQDGHTCRGYLQELYLVIRTNGVIKKPKGGVIFVPLIGKYGFK